MVSEQGTITIDGNIINCLSQKRSFAEIYKIGRMVNSI